MSGFNERTPGDVPDSFKYYTFEEQLTHLREKAGIEIDISAPDTNASTRWIHEAESTFGLHALGYTTAGAAIGGGTNWYLPDTFAFLNIFPSGQEGHGRISVIVDDEDDPDQNTYFRLLTGEHVVTRITGADIPGIATYTSEYDSQSQFRKCLRKADVLVRDDAFNEALRGLYKINPDHSSGGAA